MRYWLGRALMGLGLCIVPVGLLVGLTYDNLKFETAYLIAGLLFFFAGQMISKKK